MSLGASKFICLIVSFVFVVSCTTAYGPNSFSGGYKEKRIDENTYIVSFFGNGHTPEQQVWNYWIYRCAELTVKNNHEFFVLEPSKSHAWFDGQGRELIQFQMLSEQDNRTDSLLRPVSYYYTTVTTYSSKGYIHMYSTPVPDDAGVLMDANTILTLLRPYVKSRARVEPPSKEVIWVRSAVEAAIKANRAERSEAENIEKAIKLRI